MTSQLFHTVCIILMTLFSPPLFLSSHWPCAVFLGRIHVFEHKNANCFDIPHSMGSSMIVEAPQLWKFTSVVASQLWKCTSVAPQSEARSTFHVPGPKTAIHVFTRKNANLVAPLCLWLHLCGSTIMEAHLCGDHGNAPLWLHDWSRLCDCGRNLCSIFHVWGLKTAICIFACKNANCATFHFLWEGFPCWRFSAVSHWNLATKPTSRAK